MESAGLGHVWLFLKILLFLNELLPIW